MADALDLLQGEKKITLGHLLPAIKQLQFNLETKLSNATVTKPLLKKCIEEVERRFTPFFWDEDCILASTLHPRFDMIYVICFPPFLCFT